MNDYVDDKINEDFGEKEEKENKFEFYVAGVQHHQLKTCLREEELKEGVFLKLIPEPTNRFDPNAIRIEFESIQQGRSVMTGYVPMKISASVAALMPIMDLECEVIELNREEKPWKQLKVGIREV